MERMTKTDLRVVKTKKAIRLAFSELMSRKPMEEISISDISAEALINRKTFYAHYASVHEVIAEIEDEITASFQKLLAGKHLKDILGNPYGFFHDLLQIVNENIDVYGRLLTTNGNFNLVNKIIQMTRREICLTFEHEAAVDKQTLDTSVYFTLAGMLAVFADWYSNGKKQPIESLSEQLGRLCFDGIHGILGIAE